MTYLSNQCTRCHHSKPIDGFRNCPSCRQYQRERDKRRNRFQPTNALKASMCCVDCGASYPDEPNRLQWDHRPGEVKVGNISDLVRRGRLQEALAEIDKCDLVCASCHAKRGIQRGQIVKRPKRQCKYCYSEFSPSRRDQYYCSHRCLLDARKPLKVVYWCPPKKRHYTASTVARAKALGIPLPDGSHP